jgi:glycyl-tRNA synthetase alpha chain
MDLNFNGRDGNEKVLYRDVFLQAEQEYSRHNFTFADTDMLFEQFKMAEAACRKYLDAGWAEGARTHPMALPAYDQCIKASHVELQFDACGVISVTERQSYILRVRELAKGCGEAWLKTAAGGSFSPAREVEGQCLWLVSGLFSNAMNLLQRSNGWRLRTGRPPP